MPLQPSIVGFESPPFHYDIDARWLMAYAAGINDAAACYRDSTRTLAMHPVFPVCVEWDPILAVLAATRVHGLGAAECARSVHAEHDLHIYRPLTAGMRVRSQAVVVGVAQRSPGAFLTMRIDTLSEAGELCCRTWQGNLFRDVALDGEARELEAAPAWPLRTSAADHPQVIPLAIPEGAAHVYTECSRIWNPIHTDRAYAQAAGLPEIILHGTATLACALSALVARLAPDDPSRVHRLGGRFSGMVWLPDALQLVLAPAPGTAFEVMNAGGRAVISRGFACLHPPRANAGS